MKFDLDEQRAYACVLGMLGLTIELVAWSFFGTQPNQYLTGIFGTLTVGPVITGTIERYRSGNGSPPSSSEDPEEDAERKYGYRLMQGRKT